MKAFLLAAGLGTRLKPFTDKHPKALVEINGQSLLERNIRNLQKMGITEVVVNVHHFAGQIIHELQANRGFGSKVLISDETDGILETGGGLKRAIPLLKGSESVLMMNVDVLSNFDLKKMLQYQAETNAIATLAVQDRVSSRMLLFDSNRRLCGWKSRKTGEVKLPVKKNIEKLIPLAFSGIQILRQDFLGKMRLEGKFSIIEAYLDLCVTEKIIAWDHTNDLWLDVGKPEALEKAKGLFGKTV